MTYHRTAGAHAQDATLRRGRAHRPAPLPLLPRGQPAAGEVPGCGKKLSLFGLGTQRVEEEIARKFPELKFARVDSDSMRSSKDYEALLGRFAQRRDPGDARHADDRQGAGLSERHARRRDQRRHGAGAARLPRRRADVPAHHAGRRPRRARRCAGAGRAADVPAGRPDDPGRHPAGLRRLRADGAGATAARSACRRSRGWCGSSCATRSRRSCTSSSEELAADVERRRSPEGDDGAHEGPDALRDQPHRGLLPQPDRDAQPERRRRSSGPGAACARRAGWRRASGSRWTWIRCRCCDCSRPDHYP